MSSSAAKVSARDLATEGNEVASSFHPHGKLTAVRCWQAAVGADGVDDKVLASEIGLSKSHYSKLASGAQGDLLDLAYRVKAVRPALFYDFLARLTDAEGVDPIAVAAEVLAQAALRYLRLTGVVLPFQMARASLRGPTRKAASE